MGPEVAFEWLKDFQTLRVGPDHNLGLWLRFRHRLWVIGRVSWSETRRRQVLPRWWLEFEWFTRCGYKGICHGIEGKLSSVTHGCDDGRGGEEVHGLNVSVVPRAEIPVKGGEDGYEGVQYTIKRIYCRLTVLLSLLVLTLPLDGAQQLSATLRGYFTDLSDTRATRVGQHSGTSFLKKFGDLVPLYRGPDLFGPRRAKERDLEMKSARANNSDVIGFGTCIFSPTSFACLAKFATRVC